MTDLKIASAVILCKRDEVRDALRGELRAMGIEAQGIHVRPTSKECLALVANMGAVFLIIDWETGAEHVFDVLKGTRGESKIESLPILLIAAQLDENLYAVAKEFLISRLHVGEISRSNIKVQVRALIKETKDISPVKQLLIKVEGLIRAGNLESAKTILEQLREKAPENPRVLGLVPDLVET